MRRIGRATVLVAAYLALLANASGACITSQNYEQTALGEILRNPNRFVGRLLMISGRYEPLAEAQALVSGLLKDGGQLRVEGPVFDWIPQPREEVDVWGQVRSDDGSIYLDFYNGRRKGDLNRQLRPGDSITIVAKLRQVGSDPFVFWVLETEDRKILQARELPPGFVPLSGLIVRVIGVVQKGGFPPGELSIQVHEITIVPGIAVPPLGG